ncbi:nuclear transport factor 2 family protein [Aeromicrobium sp.]|uniref:nuclear transport factor 2 family protein n=1 Tax=Aeromicrobium sp. TaxID=1871063 RepID=UPI003D6B990F
MTRPLAVRAWHEFVRTRDRQALQSLLSDHVVFRSPAVHKAQAGRRLTTAYLEAAVVVLGPRLTYHREWFTEDSAVLEFTTVVDDVQIHGVDMLAWDDDDRLVEFTVMVRPYKALTTVIEHMAAELER